jgi:hypothetical protein
MPKIITELIEKRRIYEFDNVPDSHLIPNFDGEDSFSVSSISFRILSEISKKTRLNKNRA